MELIDFPVKKKEIILALGAESTGVFAVYKNCNIFVSENFGDLLDENNFLKYKKAILSYLKKEGIKPDVILTDLHPLFKTTVFGEELAKKYKIPHIKVQHHIAHIFSAVGDCICHPEFISGSENYRFRNKFGMTDDYKIPNTFFGIAMDGTGYGLDGNIWGGEIFRIMNYELRIMEDKNGKRKTENFKIIRIGSLEEQIMIGGDLAVKEPARMLLAILAKLQTLNVKRKINEKNKKENIYKYVKKFYSRNEFEALYNQTSQNFNCQKTTSTGRVLDAVAVLLGFAGNERKYKHEATKKLEENSSEPYDVLKPQIKSTPTLLFERRETSQIFPLCKGGLRGILQTTPLFEYLIKNIHKDKKRLAATAQLYIAKGLYKIIKTHDSKFMIHNSCFAAGGLTNNKIISSYLENYGVYLSKKIPRGDEGVAVGQIMYHLLNNN